MGPAYFREAAEVIGAAAGGPPDRAKMMDVFRRHGMTVAAPPPVKYRTDADHRSWITAMPTLRPIDLSSSGSATPPGPIVFSEGSARFKRGNQ